MQNLGHMRANEFARLGSEVYVDHAGATLPSERQLRDVFQVRPHDSADARRCMFGAPSCPLADFA